MSQADETTAPDEVIVHAPKRSSLARSVKRFVQFLFVVWVFPRLCCYWLMRPVWGQDRAFLAASERIGLIPGMWGVYCRQAFYKMTLARCGKDVYFGWGSVFAMPAACVGDRVYIGRRCGIGFATIGDETMLADGVQVLSGGREHGRSNSDEQSHQDRPQQFRRVTIGAGAWIGTNAVVMTDVGPAAVVGAGAVVNKPIPPYAVAVGVPAKAVKTKP